MNFPIFYTNSNILIPSNSAGCTRVFLIPFIFIRKKYRDDIGLHAHEAMHSKQAWRHILPPIHAIRYALSKSYRLKCEVEAYREQLKYYPDDRRLLFAEFISCDYGLDINYASALELLNK